MATVYRRLTWGGSALKWGSSNLAWRFDEVADALSSPAAGGFWPDKEQEAERRRRKKRAQELEDIIRRAAGEIPEDVPEARVIKAAVKQAEAVVEAIADAPPMAALPEFDLRPMVAAVRRVDAAIKEYKARKAREQDDEEALMLLLHE